MAVLSHFSCVWLFVTLWTEPTRLLCPWGFSRQEYWSGLPCPPPGEPLSYLKKFNKYFIFLYPLYIQISLIIPEILFFLNFTLFYFTILCWFCHTSTWVCHGCTWVPNPEPPSHFPPHTISLGHPSAPAPSILYPAWNLDWNTLIASFLEQESNQSSCFSISFCLLSVF